MHSRLFMSNSRQSTQCDLDESHIQANVMSQDDVQNDVVTAFDEKDDNLNSYFNVNENYQTDQLNWIAAGAQNKPEKYL